MYLKVHLVRDKTAKIRTQQHITNIIHSFIDLIVCLTCQKPLPKRALHIVRSRASSFRCEYLLLSLRSSISFLRLLPRLPVTHNKHLTIFCRFLLLKTLIIFYLESNQIHQSRIQQYSEHREAVLLEKLTVLRLDSKLSAIYEYPKATLFARKSLWDLPWAR
jgi:hypothetical protein